MIHSGETPRNCLRTPSSSLQALEKELLRYLPTLNSIRVLNHLPQQCRPTHEPGRMVEHIIPGVLLRQIHYPDTVPLTTVEAPHDAIRPQLVH